MHYIAALFASLKLHVRCCRYMSKIERVSERNNKSEGERGRVNEEYLEHNIK